MLGGNIEDVRERPIISAPMEAGGLPAPDIEAPEIEGERE
jgi:hypothetical protein